MGTASMRAQGNTYPIGVVIGAALLFAVGLWGLVRDVPYVNVIWYIPAWYAYLTLLDLVLYWRAGTSFVTGRRRQLAAMLFWSVPFWYLFEVANLVLENWYYVYSFRALWGRVVFSVVAFATVFPACFLHAELLRWLTDWDRWRSAGIRVTPRLGWAVTLLGLLCAILPLIWPKIFFGLIWIAPCLLPAYFTYRVGAPSLLGDLEAGRPGRLIRLLAGGLWAGVVWEALNFWARCKWIYSVPGFEDWKLFEMPIAGFLGFPFLAVGAFETYSLLCHGVHNGRHWELDHINDVPMRRKWHLRQTIAGAMAIAFVALVIDAGPYKTVKSFRPVMADMPYLDERVRASMRAEGIRIPEQLYRQLKEGSLSELSRRFGVEQEVLAKTRDLLEVALHKGLGIAAARQLHEIGIRDVEELSKADPKTLAQRIEVEAVAEGNAPAVRLTELKVAIRAARFWGGPKR